jgi:hypothetical protein
MASLSSTPTFNQQAFPAKEIRVSATTLYRVAAKYLGDATQWYRIATLNGLTDPWITEPTTLLIPQPSTSNGGVLLPS